MLTGAHLFQWYITYYNIKYLFVKSPLCHCEAQSPFFVIVRREAPNQSLLPVSPSPGLLRCLFASLRASAHNDTSKPPGAKSLLCHCEAQSAPLVIVRREAPNQSPAHNDTKEPPDAKPLRPVIVRRKASPTCHCEARSAESISPYSPPRDCFAPLTMTQKNCQSLRGVFS